jgi:gamma-glutamylputrescine oxidase
MDLLTANDRAGEYPRSYYAQAAKPGPARAAARGAMSCDVCVIGGGFTGVSAAFHLAQRGYDVVLLEAQRIGFGASGRNGGQVGTGQRLDQDELEQMVGKTRARALWDISCEAQAQIRSLCDDPLIGTTYHRGILHPGHKRRHAEAEKDYALKLGAEYGHQNIRTVETEEMRQLIGSQAYFGGSLDMDAGHVDPLRLVLGLAKKAESAGAKLYENSRVIKYELGSRCTVTTDNATISADYMVLGCNGYLGHLDDRVSKHVMPINNFIVATEPMAPETQESLIANNYAVADSKFVINYFRFSDDHRLLFGGTESYGYRFPKNIARAVRKPLLEIFPQLADVKLDHAWGGTLGITMNRMPDFRRLSGNAISLSGYSGHGVAMATMGGLIAAETISGQAEKFDIMSSVPTPAFPGGVLLRWPLLVAGMLWFSLRDRL